MIDFDDVISDYHVNYNNIQNITINTFGLGTDYYLSPTQTVGFLISGSIIGDRYMKNDQLAIENYGVPDSTITAKSNVRRHVSRVNYNLNYNGKLDKKGTLLTANLNYYTYNRTSDEYISNYFYDPAGNDYRDPLLLQNLSPSNIHIWLSAIDFSDPVSKTSKFEAGLKYSNVTSNNDFVFGPQIDGIYTSDPNFSNHFVYTENVNAAYMNFDNKWGKFNLTAGLRAEQTIARGNSLTSDHIVNSNYVDLFPSALLTYAKDDKDTYSLSFTRGIRRPGYEDLNPFLYYVDLYDYRTGNPNLKPEYSNSAELSYTYDKTFVTTLYSSIITDAYTFNFYEQNDSTKINVNTNINLGRIYNYGIRFFAPVRFTGWWNANFGVDAAYQRYIAYPQNGNLNKGTQDVIFTSEQNFVISKSLTAVISGRYESPSFYGVNQFKSNYFVNAAIGKQLFNNRGSLRLNVTDIFNTLRDRTTTDYQNLDMTNKDKKESQVARLTFTYRFGKTSLKTVVHQPGNETEQNRAGGENQ
jgi:outer membrane receptor protein involved in Fe transport